MSRTRTSFLRGWLDEVDHVLPEGQHVEPAGLTVELLAAAVDQQHARAVLASTRAPPLGEDGGVAVLLACVVHQDAAQRAVRVARAHVDGEIVGNLA